jgi:hypothetical protein
MFATMKSWPTAVPLVAARLPGSDERDDDSLRGQDLQVGGIETRVAALRQHEHSRQPIETGNGGPKTIQGEGNVGG